jgi:hypothetical protein
MSMTTRCTNCGRGFDLDRRDIVRGPRYWRLCPACRNPPAGGAAGQSPERSAWLPPTPDAVPP